MLIPPHASIDSILSFSAAGNPPLSTTDWSPC
jgi:hypothetical protein